MPPPSETTYAVWLSNLSGENWMKVGDLRLDPLGNGQLSFHGSPMLPALYNAILITEESGESDAPSDKVVYSGSVPSELMDALVEILITSPDGIPGMKPAIPFEPGGAAATAEADGDSLQPARRRARRSQNRPAAFRAGGGIDFHRRRPFARRAHHQHPQRHARPITTATAADRTRDAASASPISPTASGRSSTPSPTRPAPVSLVQSQVELIGVCIDNVQDWMGQVVDLETQFINASDLDSIRDQLAQSTELTDAITNGIDLNQNGQVEPFEGECGLQQIKDFGISVGNITISAGSSLKENNTCVGCLCCCARCLLLCVNAALRAKHLAGSQPAYAARADAVSRSAAARHAQQHRRHQVSGAARPARHVEHPVHLRPLAGRDPAGRAEQRTARWRGILLDGSLIFQTSRSDATRVFYSSDKTEIYAVDPNGLTAVHNANTGAVTTTFPRQRHAANSVAFSPDAGWLALGDTDGAVKVWDTYERQSIATIDAHSGAITALAFSADGDRLATAGADGIVRMWQWRDRHHAGETKLTRPVTIRRLRLRAGRQPLAIGSNYDARLWSRDHPQQISVLNTGSGGANEVLQFRRTGATCSPGTQTAGLSLWTPGDGKLAARLPDTQGDTIAAAFSPDGNLLLTAVLNGKVALWNLVQMTSETVNQANIEVGTQQILNVQWTDDSRLLMFFDASGAIYLWGIEG